MAEFVETRLGIRKGMRLRFLPEEQLIPTISNFVAGKIINWGDPGVLSATHRQFLDPNSTIHKLGYSLTFTTSDKVPQAFDILVEDLQRFPTDKLLLQSARLTEWWCKFEFGLGLITGIDTVSNATPAIDKLPQPSSAARRFYTAVQTQADMIIKTIDNLGAADLPNFYIFWDLWNYWHHEIDGTSDILENVKKRFENQTTYQLWEHLYSVGCQTLKRLNKNWDWPQITQVVSMLPLFRSRITIQHVVASLESNLTDNPPKSAGFKDGLDIRGVIALIKFGWSAWDQQKQILNEYYPALAQRLEQLSNPADFSVPRKYLPSTAVELLTQTTSSNPLADCTDFLMKIEEEVLKQSDMQTAWLLTLLALRARVPVLGTFIDQAQTKLDKLPGRFRQILSNKQPGGLWLTQDGKIHTSAMGFPIYTSSEVTPPPTKKQEEPARVKLEHQTIPQEPELSCEEITLPFLGKVDHLKGDVRKFLDFIFQKSKLELDSDQLLGGYASLSQQWIKVTHDRNLLYLSRLNPSNQAVKDSQQLGIEFIFIEANKLYFILRGKEKLTAFVGGLDEQGQLHIQDTNPEFIGAPQQLFLNNLALDLVTPHLYQNGLVSSYRKEDRSKINALAAFWNRFTRGSLPRIASLGENPYIVAEVEGIKQPVLLAEALKR